MNIEELKKETEEITKAVDNLLEKVGYTGGGTFAGVEHDSENPDDMFYIDEYNYIAEDLNRIKRELQRIISPVKREGVLKEMEMGFLLDDYFINITDTLEVLLYDEEEGRERWVETRIERYGDNYALLGYPTTSPEGKRARLRGGLR